MKKFMKTLLTVLCALILAFNFVPMKASAAPADNTAYLGYCDAAYKVIYLGDPLPGVTATTADITGVGQYTIGLDFTGTTDGKVIGGAAVLPVIQLGEVSYPGYFIQVDSITINGEEVSFTKGYTSVDDKGTTMSYSIYNAWAGVLPATARTPDGDLTAVSANIVDGSVFKEVKTIFVTFTLLDAEGNGPASAVEVAETATTDTGEATTETSATDTADTDTSATTDVPKTGVVGFSLIYGISAVITGAVALKRRSK